MPKVSVVQTFATLVVLWGCAGPFALTEKEAVTTPEINPSPKHQLLIHGTKDSQLGLRFRLDFVTGNTECNVSRWPGPDVAQVKHEIIPAPIGATIFEVSVHLDKYLPGKCGWRPSQLWLCASNSSKSDPCTGIASFRDNAELSTLAVTRECSVVSDPDVVMCFAPLGDLSTRKSTVLSASGGKLTVTATYREMKNLPRN